MKRRITITRREYLESYEQNESGARLHQDYYAQFVTPQVKEIVSSQIGLYALMHTKDTKSFNSIPLHHWDRIVHLIPNDVRVMLKQAGDCLSSSSGVCILKEAARQIRRAVLN